MYCRTSLGVQWLRIHLVIQGMWVPSLVRELRLHTAAEYLGPQATTSEAGALWSLPTTAAEPEHHK